MRQATLNAELIVATTAKRPFDEQSFIDQSSPEFNKIAVAKDLQEARNKELTFAENKPDTPPWKLQKMKEGKLRSSAMEIVIVDHGERFDWFGDKAHLSLASHYDDLINKVDGVLEFDLEDKNPYGIALNIDASMNTDLKTIKDKVDGNIRRVLGGGKPVEVKYFQSAVTGKKKKLTFVIPVVVGIEGNNAHKLIQLMSDIVRLKQSGSPADQEKIAMKEAEARSHPAQIIFLREIQEQLAFYSGELKKQGGMKELYCKEVDKLSTIIVDILKSKASLSAEALQNDGVYGSIKNALALHQKK